MSDKQTTTDKRRWFEILSVVLTGLLKYVLMDWLELRVFYIFSVCLFWTLYILKRYQVNRDILRDWGFRKPGFKRTLRFCLPFTVVTLISIFGYEIFYNNGFLKWNLVPVLALYPLWGIIQQFLMISVIAGNMRAVSSLNMSDNHLILVVSLLFSIVHYPDLILMAFTFVMELFFISAYFRWRNLWALGILHGWLGGLFLYLVVHRDLWRELWMIF
ncbi:MAG: protease family protein [Anaerophaga sp.]|nr:protease family protein [Anaerophaga sp.]